MQKFNLKADMKSPHLFVKCISLILILATLFVSLPLSAFAKSRFDVSETVSPAEMAEIIRLSNNLDSGTTDIEDVDDFVLSENDTDEGY